MGRREERESEKRMREKGRKMKYGGMRRKGENG